MFGMKINKKPKKIKTIRLPIFRQKGIDVAIDDNSRFILKFGNSQHIGSRKTQEDSFGYSNISNAEEIAQRGVFAVLADGMGGLSHGKQISDYVVTAMLNMFQKLDYALPIPMQLEKIIEQINNEVSNQFSEGGKSVAGSTVVAALFFKTKLYWVSVGDSRIYLLRDGFLYQMNEDHDYLNQLLGDCIRENIDLSDVLCDPQKDSLTSYIGNEKLPLIDANQKGFSLQKGDQIILCSDGVYNGITNAEMIECLKEDPQAAAEKIIRNVVHRKISSQDNSTVMIINYN